jgi:tetratricopeptide (TPR) repeat protein
LKRNPSSITFLSSKPIHHSVLLFSCALILFAAVVGLAQTSSDELIKRGKELLEQRQYYEASKKFDEAVKADPASAEAYCFRGKLALDDAQGMADLAKAIELRADYADAYFERGLKHDLANQSAAALTDYNKAIQINPQFLEAYRTRAVLYLLAGKGESAIADYTKIVELKPDGESYYMRGNSYLELGQDAKAIVDLTRSIDLDPKYYWSYMQRAKAYRHLNRLKLAQADEAKALQIGPPKID